MGLCDPVVGSELCCWLCVCSRHFDSSGGTIWTHERRLFNHRLFHTMSVWVSPCWSAASSVVLAFVVAAFPFPPCCFALSAELRRYCGVCFQSCNFDGDMAYLSLEKVCNWTFFRERWTLDKTFVGHIRSSLCKPQLQRQLPWWSLSLILLRSNRQLVRMSMSSWSVWCKQQLHGWP